jgi:type IV secretion system protein VirB10
MRARLTPALLLLLRLGLIAGAKEEARDFSGTWVLDRQQSDIRALPATPAGLLTIAQQGASIRCTEAGAAWTLHTDGTESKYQLRDSSMNSLTKWEGPALLINTLVGGADHHVVMDRWELSKDRTVLTITRTVQRGSTEVEGTLVYHNQDRLPVPLAPAAAVAPAAVRESAVAPAAPAGFVIQAGTKIPLGLLNSLNTRHSAEGDRVYLETVFPIAQDGRIVIPRGSYVAGTVTEVKRASHTKGKAELFLRFDSLTLPNGVTRDFRSRLDGSDTGKVDRQEGKIQGDGNKAGDAKTVGETAGAGASVGAIAGSAAGHAGMGVGIGAVGGAAAGLAGVMLSHGPDLVLPKGTTFEMVLDRPLRYEPHELEVR